MSVISSRDIGEAVRSAIGIAATSLRADVRSAIERAAVSESSARGREVLSQMLENAAIAERDGVPLCQDTGTTWVWVELGLEERLGSDLAAAVDEAVRTAYREGALRMSVVRDAIFDRRNTGDNTPAFLDVTLRPGTGATVHVMLKGGGSDNASVVRMLEPSAGIEGVRRLVLDTVSAKGASACPPLVVGVGAGGTFDSVGKLAKKALLREVGSTPRDELAASLEAALLADVNALGIGPAGLGGATTALAVHVVTAPCHIAALPVAVNLGCSSLRTVTVEIG
ncbi:MAG TPA: fumarate hydratase [Coriobacteriia bacterium]|nr:MAG: Hydrolyase, tartrate alpha subunit/fumarate domain-containing protein, Fe-S type [Actinobacteria bacterium 66_15]HAL30390.1 fumarate hydratase [Coriobacteriia bacterium]